MESLNIVDSEQLLLRLQVSEAPYLPLSLIMIGL